MIIFCGVKIHAQNDNLWQKVSSGSVTKRATVSNPETKYYKLNIDFLKSKLSSSTNKAAGKSSNTTSEITIPNADGVLERFTVWESSNFSPELQAKYPDIRAYEGTGLDDKTAKLHFSLAPIGIQTVVFRADKSSEFIEQNPDDTTTYALFTKQNTINTTSPLVCSLKDVAPTENSKNTTSKTTASNKVFKTYRLALSCTAEYTAYFGGTKAGALAGMNATLSRVNGVFNKDLAVKLELIANNEDIIYLDPVTDPYSNANKGTSTDPSDDNDYWSKELQSTLTATIGEANYDIGHLFGASGGGGNAACIGCICDSPTPSDVIGKGSAYTSPSNAKPQGDTFDIDFVAHEIGHQLGANHTFSFDGRERTGVNVEPGSGSTIMGYAGVSKGYDVQLNSDDYFAYASILQIQNNLASKSCGVNTSLTNNPPVIDAGIDYTIPISTAFVLTGKGSDPEGDTITYTWEQNDSATSSTTTNSNSLAYPTKPDGPLFRSVIPGSSAVRYFPTLNTVLQNKLTTNWESVSSIARTLHFTLTGRDNAALGKAQTGTDAVIVNVVATAGPFTVTSQNADDGSWPKGSSQTITWTVNNTNTLQGSANVNIKLSLDGGVTFPVTLASNTPNDGSEVVQIPSGIEASTNCRVLIEPTGNIYYAVNSKRFSVGYTSTTTCDSYSFGSAFAIPSGSTFTSKTVNIPASTGTVSDVNVLVNVTHDRLSDFELQIVSPQGTVVNLYNKTCGGIRSTLALQFDDSGVALDCSKTTSQIVVPVEALNVFNGQNPQGTWTFKVRDDVSGNFGTINSASVSICNQTFTLGNPDLDNVDFVLFPNPNKGNFTIQFPSDSVSRVQIAVHDILGKKVYSNSFDPTSYFNQNIQLSNVSSGIYMVTIVDGNRRTVKKMIVN